MSLFIIIVALVVVVLGKRVRDNGGVTKTLKKIRVSGIWFIGSGSSSNDSGSTPRNTNLDRTSSSTEFMVESFNQSDHGNSGLYTWQPITAPVVEGDEGGATCVIGERGKDARKWTPLHCETVRFSGDHTLQEIIMHDYSQLDSQGPGGFTPLMIAIVSQEKKNRHKLIPVPSDSSSSSSDQNERDILMTTCAPPYSHGGPVDGMMMQGHIPHHHHHLSHYSPVGIFLGHQANVNIGNDYGQTALHLAAKHGRDDYVHMLLAAKADPNLQDIWGQTALHVSIGAATDRAFKVWELVYFCILLYTLVYSCILLYTLVYSCVLLCMFCTFLDLSTFYLYSCIFLCILVYSCIFCILSGSIGLSQDQHRVEESGRSDSIDYVCEDG